MEDSSIFQDKAMMPTERDLRDNLGNTFDLWIRIRDFVMEQYPNGEGEWNFPGKKYGWSFRIKDKKRAIIYLLPRELYFKVAFIFGDKAMHTILESNVAESIKTELQQARKYAEGRGIRIDVKNEDPLEDIKKLVEIKLKF
ncbi:MAG TPA: DUF3788 domain-containing protein [Bacteroidales bacterium]|nr:DUF3788 domain-containing protein [Bacteroidales bacterium]